MGLRMAMRTAAVTAGAALLLSACGSGDENLTSSGSSAALPTAAAIVDPAAGPDPQFIEGSRLNTALPALQVVRVASNETVALQKLAPTGKPMLLWFWAPHCTFCRAEAPKLLAFERAHRNRITILGLGAQDDLDQAVDFLADTGTENLDMVWDRTGKSWLHFEVTNQPTVVVVDADGTVTKTWFRDFDAEGILAAAGLA